MLFPANIIIIMTTEFLVQGVILTRSDFPDRNELNAPYYPALIIDVMFKSTL